MRSPKVLEILNGFFQHLCMKIEIEKADQYGDVIIENEAGGKFSFCFDDSEAAEKFSAELRQLIDRYQPR